MNYFFKSLFSVNKKFFTFTALLGIWAAAIVDVFSLGLGSGGVLNGWWFKITVILTVVGLLSYIFYLYFTDLNKRKKIAAAEEEAAIFEPKRKEEIKEILKENPNFITLCFKCYYFNRSIKYCSLELNQEIPDQKIKEVKFNDKKYCLYWVPVSDKQNSEI